MLAKTEDSRSETPIEEDYWVEGIEWADSLGAQIVSSSLGYTDWYTFADMDGKTAVTTLAADRAAKLGIVIVTANGNERRNSWGHVIAPADGDSVIAVGAVTSSGSLSSFSSPGPTYDGRIKPEVCAQGTSTFCARNSSNTAYGYSSGTSLSTPLVAGVAALLLEAHPEWTPMQLREALMMTASNPSAPNNDYGWGIVNVLAALDYKFSRVSIRQIAVDDDSADGSLGNGNQQLDSDETIALSIALTNDGDASISNFSASLRADDPYISIIDSLADYPELAAGTMGIGSSPFRIQCSADLPQLHAVEFTLHLFWGTLPPKRSASACRPGEKWSNSPEP